MNEVFNHPVYQRDLNKGIEEMKIFLFMPPDSAYQIIRAQITEIVNSAEFKKEMKCGSIANCSFCCHDTISMGRVEADHIKNVIRRDKIIPNKHRVEAQNNRSTTIKWVDKACPMLLDENEKGQRLCSIYEDRPLICRTHNSSMDPIKCDREKNPNASVREARSGRLDAFYFTSVILGQTGKPENKLIGMHQALREMGF